MSFVLVHVDSVEPFRFASQVACEFVRVSRPVLPRRQQECLSMKSTIAGFFGSTQLTLRDELPLIVVARFLLINFVLLFMLSIGIILIQMFIIGMTRRSAW